IRGANPADDFDQFTVDRNLRDDRVLPPVHVSLAMPGYEDLDEYGAWSETPDDGWVWTPRVAADWVPYQQGRWAWVEPWGWTWIDEAPWGFAPFHFGRWAFLRASWVWVPGAVTRRPVYAPALVVFVSGPRSGAIGWFPLGPREPFYPAYRVSAAYLRQVNITHVTNINVIGNGSATNVRYTNQQVPGAVMAMPRQGFAGSRPVREQGQRVSPQQLAQAEVPVGSPGIAPLRESMMGGRTNQRIATPSQAAMTRPVVARSAPPPPRVSFQATQLLIEQNNGRPLAPDQLVQLRQAQPAATVNRAPVRTLPAGVPAPVNAPAPLRPAERPADRMITRPPGTRPEPRNPEAVRPTAPQTARPELTRPQPERQPERQADRQPERRTVPPAAPAAVRPQAEVRRESAPVVREPRAEPRQDVRPEPAKPEPKKEDKK
ncbi:MAG: DUF6600 domain-containing protein, partial [Acidobacteriota bacterium]